MEALGGTLIIEVIEAKLDRDTEGVGKMDCFVEVKYKDQVKRTKVHHEGGVNPKWEEKLEISLESLQDKITISCYDEDALSNDLVGEHTVSVGRLTSVDYGFD